MSSSLRSFSDAPGTGKQNFTRFHNLTTSSYFDSSLDLYIPIPFAYADNVLEINNMFHNAESDLINPGYLAVPYSEYMVRQLGGKGLITGIGIYFENYIKNMMGDEFEQNILNIRVHTPGIVTKVQQSTQIPPPSSGSSDAEFSALGQFGAMSWSTTPPSSGGYIYNGSDDDSWNSFWVFVEPLTLSFKTANDSVTRYLTFNSQFTKNIPYFLT